MFPEMRLELAERLICPAAHARTPLIVVAEATADRDLLRGTAGCMTCYREARFDSGTLLFAAGDATAAHSALDVSESLAERLEALLGVSEPGMPLLLSARYVRVAHVLAERHEAMVAVLSTSAPSALGVGNLIGHGDVVPFTDATFAAAALGDEVSPALLADVMRSVRVGGRVLAAASLEVPPQARELARDSTDWLAEVVAAPSPVVPLRRASA